MNSRCPTLSVALWILLWTAMPGCASAQTTPPPVVPTAAPQVTDSTRAPGRRPAFSVGLGAATDGIGGALLLAMPTSRAERDLMVRLAASSSIEIFQDVSDDNVEFALLYGFRTVESPLWIRGAAGLGLIRITRPGEVIGCEGFFFFAVCDYEEVHNTTLGVAVHLDAGLAVTRSFGVGVMAMGNVNGDRSFGVFALTFSLGGLR